MDIKNRLRASWNVLRRGTIVAPIKEYTPGIRYESSSGVNVTVSNATKFTAVYSCVRILSEIPASLPIQVTRTDKDGKREDLTGQGIYNLLHAPNAFMNRFTFIELMNANLQLHGNAYAVIIFDQDGFPVRLIPVNPANVKVKVFRGEPFYEVNDRVMDIKGTYFYWEIIHFKMLTDEGLLGISPIERAKNSIGLGLAAEDYGATFFKKGGNMKAVIESESYMNDKQFKEWKSRWDAYYSGERGNHETPLLEYGLKYKPLGIPPEQAQFIATRIFQLQEVARIFNVPPHLLADLSRATFSNIEHSDIQFVKYTLRGVLKRQEVELEQKLVPRGEQGSIHIKYVIDGLLRGDMRARAQYLHTMVTDGIFSVNEARDIENKTPLPGKDEPYEPAHIVGKQSTNNTTGNE